ncbi:hypothetical protein [Bradyrhizobium sp. JYMT SZCCT0428]|uniref:hypothetical protein n=1 Tax=Bradyrhizobium sp. JYMT SZCCT0428 TaxID=2807673 RepID=UPI001BAB464A|nr:hypothetical protein [Bradyrhizobium sp. JYMT SZCCT0428]MBR1154044.1 hypothetical protein [Bradyrhizobium sp. JYMT SZCCT0428]
MSIARTSAVEIDAVLHPARAFSHPMDVVRDADLTLYEKRAILSSWASDACAVENLPEFRHPSGAAPVKFDDIMDALRVLDSEQERRVGPTQRIGWRSSPQESGEAPPL